MKAEASLHTQQSSVGSLHVPDASLFICPSLASSLHKHGEQAVVAGVQGDWLPPDDAAQHQGCDGLAVVQIDAGP